MGHTEFLTLLKNNIEIISKSWQLEEPGISFSIFHVFVGSDVIFLMNEVRKLCHFCIFCLPNMMKINAIR